MSSIDSLVAVSKVTDWGCGEAATYEAVQFLPQLEYTSRFYLGWRY